MIGEEKAKAFNDNIVDVDDLSQIEIQPGQFSWVQSFKKLEETLSPQGLAANLKINYPEKSKVRSVTD